jgi:hypothetical protein
MIDTNWVIAFFVSWLPFIVWVVLIGLFGIMLARRIERSLRAPDGRSLGHVLDDYVREMRRSNDLLAQVIKDHGARPASPDGTP